MQTIVEVMLGKRYLTRRFLSRIPVAGKFRSVYFDPLPSQ